MADNKGGDGVFLFIFLLIVMWGGGWLVWKNFRPQLTSALLVVRSAELGLADIWMNDDDIVHVPMPRSTDDEGPLKAKLGDNERTEMLDTPFGTWKTYAANVPVANVTNDHIRVMSYVAIFSLRWPIAAILFALFIWSIFKGPTSSFHRTLGLQKLMQEQAKTFPVISPFLKFDPNELPIRAIGDDVPVDLPMFAEALAPEEWLAVNEVPVTDNIPERHAAEAGFSKQLGPVWKGYLALPGEIQVLLAACCLKASRKRNEADELLGRLAACWDQKSGLKLSRDRALLGEARKILKNKKLAEKTLANCNRHAYISTAMMRALNTAREEGGVLASAQFVWLRAHNRALWYPLNNLGRQAFHMESLGVCAHYRAEKQINRPIMKPRVMDAVDGLIEFQKNMVMVRPLPGVNYGSGKNKKSKNSKAA